MKKKNIISDRGVIISRKNPQLNFGQTVTIVDWNEFSDELIVIPDGEKKNYTVHYTECWHCQTECDHEDRENQLNKNGKWNMEYSVYIVKCNDDTLYTGISNNVNNRVVKHNKSRGGSKYTRGRQPVRLVYSKVIGTKSDALKEEYKIKQLSRSEKLKLLSTTQSL